MANRFPLIANSSANQIQELASGDFLDLSQSGISNSGNILVSGIVSTTGNITGSFIIGNGSQLTGLPAGYSNADVATYLASGTVSTNILTTSALSATGNVTGGNIRTAGLISATGAVTGGALTGTSLTVTTGNITGGNLLLSGAIIDSAQLDIQTSAANANIALAPNGTGIVTVSTQVSAVGNVTGGNLITGGAISATGNIRGATITAVAGFVGGTGTFTTIVATTSIQTNPGVTASIAGNVTGGNFLTAGLISATGAITGSSLTVSTGNVSCGNIVNNNANGVGNIGSATTYFNTVFAKATSAQYADLAEMYVADADYMPGTVVEFGGDNEVTTTTQSHSTRVAGIVSTNPSYLMNATQTGHNVIPVALTGRVPCSVVGTIVKGDRLVASDIPGVAQPLNPTQYQPACIIGKALENYSSDQPGVIEVAVGRT
jgi:hypothetical protein